MFYFLVCPEKYWEQSTPSLMNTGGSFLKIKWPGHEADHSLASIAYVENNRSYTSISSYTLTACTLVS